MYTQFKCFLETSLPWKETKDAVTKYNSPLLYVCIVFTAGKTRRKAIWGKLRFCVFGKH